MPSAPFALFARIPSNMWTSFPRASPKATCASSGFGPQSTPAACSLLLSSRKTEPTAARSLTGNRQTLSVEDILVLLWPGDRAPPVKSYARRRALLQVRTEWLPTAASCSFAASCSSSFELRHSGRCGPSGYSGAGNSPWRAFLSTDRVVMEYRVATSRLRENLPAELLSMDSPGIVKTAGYLFRARSPRCRNQKNCFRIKMAQALVRSL